MSRPMTRIHNADTGEIIDREMTEQEFEEYVKHNEVLQNMKVLEDEARATAEAKLAALGLTADDLKALGL
jgi:c-di-AMP phosphodiesterase-like protein